MARTSPQEELLPGWEIVARKAPFRLGHSLAMLVQALFTFQMPGTLAPVTFTLRETESGTLHTVTAHSIEEARLRVVQGKFD